MALLRLSTGRPLRAFPCFRSNTWRFRFWVAFDPHTGKDDDLGRAALGMFHRCPGDIRSFPVIFRLAEFQDRDHFSAL